MIVVVSVQVALRYAAQHLLDWSDEVSRLLFVWCMFLAIPLGIREGAHVGIELLVDPLSRACAALLANACTTVGAIGLMAIVFYETVIVAWDTWDELLPTLDMSANWFLVPVAVSAAHSILHLVQLLWRDPVRTVVAMTSDAMSTWVMVFFWSRRCFGMPLAFALGIAAHRRPRADPSVDFNMLPPRMMNAVNSFPLMSIPLFMVAGELMIKGGIMEQTDRVRERARRAACAAGWRRSRCSPARSCRSCPAPRCRMPRRCPPPSARS